MSGKIEKLCDSFLEMGVPGFDLAVYVDGQCALRYMGGYADLENKVPMNGKERYNLYSCSKFITCVAAMQLWEKGLFSLDDKLSDYLPEFANMLVRTANGIQPADKPIRIKHLFEMTAGFDYNLSSPAIQKAKVDTLGRCPTREVMKYLAKEPLCFEPGQQWKYSFCHDVLAVLIEVISGKRFSEYVKENIFDPLGMCRSTFCLPDSELGTIACQYRFDNNSHAAVQCGKNTQVFKLGTEYESGGAGCVSTVDDYILFLEAVRIGNVILKKETIELMATNRLNKEQCTTYLKRETHGYGLGIRTPKDGGVCRDFGWDGAAGAYMAIDVSSGVSLYYAQHILAPPNNEISGWLYRFVMAEMFGKEEFKSLINGCNLFDKYRFA